MLEYIQARSIIHDLHPLIKLAWAVLILILALIFNSPWVLTTILLSVVAAGLIGRVLKDTLVYLLAMLIVAGFVFLFQVLFQSGGQTYFHVFPYSWPVVGGRLPVTERGVLYGIAMSLRMLCFVSPFPVIFATTQPRDMVMSLVETLRVPYDFAFMFLTAMRFIPIMMSEVSTISQAQRSRGYAVEGYNPIRKLKALGPIAIPIVFIAIEKAERLGLCMELRGYGTKERTYLRKLTFGTKDVVTLALMLMLLSGSIVARLSGLGYMVLPR